jgi:hypothetical protein
LNNSKNHLFVGLVLSKWKVLLKIGKEMVQIQGRYFHLAFERIFSDVPLLRSSRHKIRVEKERKKELDGTRVKLRCEMRCEAVGCWVVMVNFLFIFDSDVHIQIFVVTRTLSVYANILFRKTTDWRFNYLSESFII